MAMRAKKSGIGKDIEKKLEDKYDEEDAAGVPYQIALWIQRVIKDQHDVVCADSSWSTIQQYLQDGVVLCKLINVLLKSAGKKGVSFKPNAAQAFFAMANIEEFLRGAAEYGLPQLNIFNSIDLYEGRKGPFLNVINCLHKLGVLANKNEFSPRYAGVSAPTRDSDTWSHT